MAPVAGTSAPSFLLAQPTQLLGREQEVAALGARLRDAGTRLVTLTGAGGIGKTRLALAAAERAAAGFPDGVVFVDLQPVDDPARVLQAIAGTLEVVETPDRSLLESVAHFLGARRALLVLDNFEQVLPAAADVAALLARCPSVRVLAGRLEALTEVSGTTASAIWHGRVVIMPEEDARGWAELALTNSRRHHAGLPGLVVIDLRHAPRSGD